MDLPGGLANELLASPVHRGVAAGDGLVRRGGMVDNVGALLGRAQPGDGLQQLLLAAAGDARHAQYLPAHGLEGDVVQGQDAVIAADGQVPHLQPQRPVLHQGAVNVQRHGPAHHHLRQLLGVCPAGGHVPHILPLPQHGHPVGDGHDLVELVGDDDDGFPVGAHVPQHVEEPVGLLGRQHGGGLIQDQDVRPPVEDLHDLHRLLLRHGHVVDLLLRVHGEAVTLADLPDPAAHGLQIQPSRLLEPQDDVLRRDALSQSLEMLVDHADAQVKGVLGGADGDGLPPDGDVPLVGVVDPGQHVH